MLSTENPVHAWSLVFFKYWWKRAAMTDRESYTEHFNSTKRCESPSVSSDTQPFVFREFTVRELITPSKEGIVALKDVSLSYCGNAEWSPNFPESWKTKFSSLKYPRNPFTSSVENQQTKQDDESLMLPSKLLWNNTSVGTSEMLSGKLHKRSLDESLTRTSHSKLRSLFKRPPSKRAKIDPIHFPKKKSRHSQKVTGSESVRNQEAKQLHWKYVSIISLLPLLMLSSVVYFLVPHTDNYVRHSNWNLEELNNTLRYRVYGQDYPITSLLNILDTFLTKDVNIHEEQPVILLTGSSGVGKSLVSSIIASNFPLPGKTELVLFPFPSPERLLTRFSERGFNLIVVDSLNGNFIADAVDWTRNLFNEAKWLNKPVILVLVCNFQEGFLEFELDGKEVSESSHKKGEAIQKKLQSYGFDTHHVHFNLLTKEHVKKCVEVALRKRGVSNDIDEYSEIIIRNINIEFEGCKSVWSRTAPFGLQ